jgi:hypothetical protein
VEKRRTLRAEKSATEQRKRTKEQWRRVEVRKPWQGQEKEMMRYHTLQREMMSRERKKKRC